ncbi:MAG: two-component sensor histidine kinase, partial [Gemmobacter sp.]|uniref:sensor histidine kinase n=1 Tax=Gemmobacter sp. TaxID=1898957 RepID=UPI001A6207AC
QRAELERQVLALEELSWHNNALRLRVQGASARVAAAQDQALRRVGADLHDGPAQLMAYAALRLDGLPVAPGGEARLAEVTRAVQDAIRDIRSVLRGVALPDIAARSPCAIVQGLAEAQAARAGLPVAVECAAAALPELGEAQKICLYRFVQEGLTNAWRHGEGRGMAVVLRPGPEGGIEALVRDAGPGFTGARSNPEGLGLAGLRDRVEALGGTLEPRAGVAGGAELRMTLPVAAP